MSSERWVRRMEWYTVSKAAERSRRMRMEMRPLSAALRRSVVILMRAVSVLCRILKPDWRGSKSSY